MSHAHENHVIHRDLKPSNILVRETGDPALLDFGIAKLMDPVTMGAATLTIEMRAFTPEYASPEQMMGAPVSAASDVYSLGVLLYRVLTGRSNPYVPPRRGYARDAPSSLNPHPVASRYIYGHRPGRT